MSRWRPDDSYGCLQDGCELRRACFRYVNTAPPGSFQHYACWDFVTDDVKKTVDCDGFLNTKQRRVR